MNDAWFYVELFVRFIWLCVFMVLTFLCADAIRTFWHVWFESRHRSAEHSRLARRRAITPLLGWLAAAIAAMLVVPLIRYLFR